MAENFDDFNERTIEMVHVMVDALRERWPTGEGVSSQHMVGAAVMMFTAGLMQIPEQARLDLVLLLIPKLLKIAGAEAEMVEVDKPTGTWVDNIVGSA